jgi:hypothetical protein
MKYNPFKPTSIVHSGMFSGRIDELKIIEKLLFQTKNGNSSSFIVTGERGIGKSSLLYCIELVARGNISSINGETFRFLCVSISLEPNDDYDSIILKIAREFKRELDQNEKVKSSLLAVWDFITNWEVLGVKYNNDKGKDSVPANVMLEDLSEKIMSVLKNSKKELDGIYIFIDESDKPVNNPNIGELTKSMTERIQKRGVNNFAFGIIGLPLIMDKIKESHESALRLFTSMFLKQLTTEESGYVVDLGLNEANEKNTEKTTIIDDAKIYIATFSEGYPHFIQQYAYSAFDADTDNNITREDVIKGLLGDNGALKQLGERYFDKMYFRDIYSTNYRKILGIMAKASDEYITKKQIIKQSGLTETNVTNAIGVFLKKGMIILKKGTKGSYKISTRSFAAWIITLENAEKN